MASEWPPGKLGDYVKLQSGGTPSKSRTDFWNGNIPWVSAKDMKTFWVEDSEDHLTEAGAAKAKIVPARSTLILVRGMTLHNDLPICRLRRPSAFNQDVKAVIPQEGLHPEFLPYLLVANKTSLLNSVDSAGHGTGRLNTETLTNLPVSIPPLEEQKRLADFANAIEDKIELNRRMNATLEAMARALFKAWFVDFEPVHAIKENRPSTSASPDIAKLFPSDFENGFPKGWVGGTVADIARISKDSVSPGKFPDEEFHHFSIPAFDDGKHPRRELGSTILSNKFLIQGNSVLVSKLNPRIFRAWTVFPVADSRCIASTEFILYETRQAVNWSFLNSLLRSDEIISSFQQHVTGTSGSHQRVKPESTLNIPIVIPSDCLLETFNEIVGPIYSLAQMNIDQIQSLCQTRESLLPRLISGKLRVDKAEEREHVV